MIACTVKELSENMPWYKSHHPEGQLLDDEAWEIEWREIVKAASPTHGARVGIAQFLGGIHILAMANILNRPILVLDTPTNLQQDRGSNIDGCGMYLPSRRTREDLLAANNRCLSPIMIGWKSAVHDHFVAIVPKKFPSARSTHEFHTTSQWEVMLNRLHVRNPKPYIDHLYHLVTCNPPMSRDTACTTIRTLLLNLKRFEKSFCNVRLENRIIKHDVVSVDGALDLLLQLGFQERNDIDESGASKPSLVFPTDINTAQIMMSVCDHQFVIDFLSNFIVGGMLHAVPYGQAEIKSVQSMEILFGKTPFLTESWENALSIYGNGAKAVPNCPGSAWCFGSGNSGLPLVRSIMDRGIQNFNLLGKEVFGGWSDFMARSLDTPGEANVVECPVCRSFLEWPHITNVNLLELVSPSDLRLCPHCLSQGRATQLSVTQTKYLRVLDMVKSAYSSTAKLWKCQDPSCQVANFQIHEHCRLCWSTKPVGNITNMEIDALESETVTAKRKLTSCENNDVKSDTVESSVNGSSSSQVKRTRSVGWICLHCRSENVADLSKCENCCSVKGSKPTWLSSLDPTEQTGLIFSDNVSGSANDYTDVLLAPSLPRRVLSAVVHSTEKDLSGSAPSLVSDFSAGATHQSFNPADSKPPLQLVLGDDIPTMESRVSSTPVTQGEKVHAKSILSSDAIGLEAVWSECFSSIMEEVNDDGDGIVSSFTVNFKLE